MHFCARLSPPTSNLGRGPAPLDRAQIALCEHMENGIDLKQNYGGLERQSCRVFNIPEKLQQMPCPLFYVFLLCPIHLLTTPPSPPK